MRAIGGAVAEGVGDAFHRPDIDLWRAGRLFHGGKGGLVYPIQDPSTLYSDVGKTTLASVDGNVAVISDIINGHDATQGTGVSQPKLRQTAGGIYYVEYDGTDDFHSIPVAAWNPAVTHYTAWMKYSGAQLRVINTGTGDGKDIRTFISAGGDISFAATTSLGNTAIAVIPQNPQNVDVVFFGFQSHDGAKTTVSMRVVTSSFDLEDSVSASGVISAPDDILVGRWKTDSTQIQIFSSILRHEKFTAAEQSRIISYFRSQGANV